jgi:hypothetical protein
VCRIKKSEIREAARHGNTPDFFQECFVWRMTKRRDIMARVFNLPIPDEGAGEPPTISVPLTTRGERQAAARRYKIPLSEIEQDLARTGFLPADNLSADTENPFHDVLAKNGKIQKYHDTVILGILRDTRHPSGFVRRLCRFDDDDEFVSKRFRQRN